MIILGFGLVTGGIIGFGGIGTAAGVGKIYNPKNKV